MKVSLECISTPTADTAGTSFALQIEARRYVFGNLHEGFQRAALEQGTKFARVSDVFLTGKTEWKSTGGIIGFILTLADAVQSARESLKETQRKAQERSQSQANGDSSQEKLPIKEPEASRLGLHGGPNLARTIATGRRFIFRKGLPIDVFEHTDATRDSIAEPTWKDDSVRVWALPVQSAQGSQKTSPKRSFAQYQENPDDEGADGHLRSTEAPDIVSRKSKLLQGVIKDMFESDWRLDAMFDTPLRELELPATVFVRNPENKKIEKYAEKIAEDPAERPDITVLVRRPWPGALVANLPPTSPSPISTSYVVRTHTLRGKFLPKKAVELGIPPSDHYRRLAEGETVTLDDGREVKPEQVLGPPKPSSGFLIADLPSIDYLDDFLSRPELSEPLVMENLKAMIWHLGAGVEEDTRFQNFVTDHAYTQHIIALAASNANPLVFESAAAAAIRHSIIDPERYGIPSFNNISQPLPSTLSHCKTAQRGMTIQFEPSFKLDMSTAATPLNTAAVVESLPPAVRRAAEEAQQEAGSEEYQTQISEQEIPGGENEIITLGTGSAAPSKYRNVSATLLRVPNVGSYLFDCGENTLGQLARIYKPEQLKDILSDLKMVWISHLHADHHLGTTAIIKAWYEATETEEDSQLSHDDPLPDPVAHLNRPRQLFIASDEAMIQWLREYAEIENYGRDRMIFLDVGQAQKTTHVRWLGKELGITSKDERLNEAFKSATGLADFAVCYVPHCKGSQGVALTFPDGFKITYSGDTRPAKSLVDIGQNSTVLLHEATFEDERAGDAQAKNHSTTSQAVNVGREMNARRVLLTHFSQRYTKIPVMSDIKPQPVGLGEADEIDDDPLAGMTGDDVNPPLEPADEAVKYNRSQVDRVAKGVDASSLRTQSRPTSSASNSNDRMKVGVAFDGMRVKVKHIMALEKFTPAFMKLYEGANATVTLSEEAKAERQQKYREQKTAKKAELKEKARQAAQAKKV